eukprot:CAMPEP_0170240352 /NCGR_PEP_ID=MMETSP0116_2-20130129/19934_1 /TAXON_ID=400756 /ORGANISM="Durinskia baltica, Strain CSIRO CS-38" /LENGTH=46 /DNA_ID= /DNA_START= /DNA_END= /DNA_ORIENTATION=
MVMGACTTRHTKSRPPGGSMYSAGPRRPEAAGGELVELGPRAPERG